MKGWIKWTMAGLVLLIIGCGGGGGGGGDNTPPNVTDVQVNPTKLSFLRRKCENFGSGKRRIWD
jgi:hypothetical protein